MDAAWVLIAIFIAVLALVAFAVARGLWRLIQGDYEPEAGGRGAGSSSACAGPGD